MKIENYKDAPLTYEEAVAERDRFEARIAEVSEHVVEVFTSQTTFEYLAWVYSEVRRGSQSDQNPVCNLGKPVVIGCHPNVPDEEFWSREKVLSHVSEMTGRA